MLHRLSQNLNYFWERNCIRYWLNIDENGLIHQKTRKVLDRKIAQLNSAIDDVSTQLRPEDKSNGVAGDFDEVEAAG